MNKMTESFIDHLVEMGALGFGDYTLKSGRKSPFFVNIGRLTTGKSISMLAAAYSDVIMSKFCDENGKPQFDVLYGPAYKGIPIAAATVFELYETYEIDVVYAANRKEAKDHGEQGMIVGGPILKGAKVLIVEDVTTSGKSIAESMEVLSTVEGGVEVIGEIVALDRQEKALDSEKFALDAISEEYGFPVIPVVTMADVVEHLYEKGDRKIITEDIYQRIQAYYAEYGGKK